MLQKRFTKTDHLIKRPSRLAPLPKIEILNKRTGRLFEHLRYTKLY